MIRCHLIRVTVTRLPNGRAVPGPLWLWWAGPGSPDLDLCWRAYLHRFDIEHTYRLAKHHLGWDKAALRHPEQVARWTWLIICAITQLRLVRPLAEDHRQRWERRRKPGRAHPRPRPQGFSSPGRTRGHAGQPAKTLPGRPRPPQRPDQHPRTQAPRPQEGRLTVTLEVKTQA